VILLHGAEAATRSLAYRMHANVFLSRGMAVLLYDKRGAGASGGWSDSITYEELIEDALAGIRLLRSHPGIDPDRIGIVGASESGWLTPEIAERAGNVDFVINKVGPCGSWRETVEWEVYNGLLAEHVGDSTARHQAAIRRQIWDYYVAPSDSAREMLATTLQLWKGMPDSHLPDSLSVVGPGYIQRVSYDPTPFLERLNTPTMYVYGSDDVNIPTKRCVERLSELQEAGRPVSWHVFEHEGHELGGVGLRGYRFVDGYAKLLGDFAAAHVR
jgi:hypothetical protein